MGRRRRKRFHSHETNDDRGTRSILKAKVAENTTEARKTRLDITSCQNKTINRSLG